MPEHLKKGKIRQSSRTDELLALSHAVRSTCKMNKPMTITGSTTKCEKNDNTNKKIVTQIKNKISCKKV
eukprot:226157-Amphidinium_carterae.1